MRSLSSAQGLVCNVDRSATSNPSFPRSEESLWILYHGVLWEDRVKLPLFFIYSEEQGSRARQEKKEKLNTVALLWLSLRNSACVWPPVSRSGISYHFWRCVCVCVCVCVCLCVCACVRAHLISLCCLPIEEEGLVSVNRAFTILLLSYCTLPVRTIYDLDWSL